MPLARATQRHGEFSLAAQILINLKTTKTLGLTVWSSVLAHADEVIE